jgi:hypothetical protein
VPAGGPRHLRLAFGPGKARTARPAHALKVETTAEGCTVDTGAIRFTPGRGGSGFPDRVWHDAGDPGAWNVKTKLHTMARFDSARTAWEDYAPPSAKTLAGPITYVFKGGVAYRERLNADGKVFSS